MCIDSYCTKGTKNNHWLFCLVEFLSQNTLIRILAIVEKKQWSNLCLHSGRRHSVCEIYVNKRYCFCTEINLAWFPSIYCMRRHLAAYHLWMHGRLRGRGGCLSKMKQTPQEPEFCNSVDRFVCLYICFVMVCLNLT